MCPFRMSWWKSLKLCDYSFERIQQRTVEEVVDVPVPLVEGGLLSHPVGPLTGVHRQARAVYKYWPP